MAPPDPRFWAGRTVLLTGHTGFKGTWLALWLSRLGAKVVGLALPPDTSPSLFELTHAERGLVHVVGDVRDAAKVADVVREHAPEIVLHLAAQPLVRRSYREPLWTLSTNVMGTAHVLEACRGAPGLRAVLVVTTDKVYENREHLWAYREPDALGGHDPYSASKACAELVTASYRDAFLRERGVGVATARAGNVFGGGDWCEDRLVPDLVRGAAAGAPTTIRNPRSTRPWQHVLEPLSGYLELAQRLVEEPERFSEAWNFGPADDDVLTAGELAELFVRALGRGSVTLAPRDASAPHEAAQLRLDASKARARLGWRPRLPLREALAWTAEVYRAVLDGEPDVAATVLRQLDDYERR